MRNGAVSLSETLVVMDSSEVDRWVENPRMGRLSRGTSASSVGGVCVPPLPNDVVASVTAEPKPGLPNPGLPNPGLPKPGLPKPGLPNPGLPNPGVLNPVDGRSC